MHYEYIALVADILQKGFLLITVLLLIGRMLLRSRTEVFNQLVVFSNAVLLIAAILYLGSALQLLVFSVTADGEYEKYSLVNRIAGPYWWAYWGGLLFNGLLPQLLWLKRLRGSLYASLALAPFLVADYWLPLLFARHRDYLPSSWFMVQPEYHRLAIVAIVYTVAFLLLFSVARRIKSW
jgi:molybdopterin-containing oxidoreductase family membrane subunit